MPQFPVPPKYKNPLKGLIGEDPEFMQEPDVPEGVYPPPIEPIDPGPESFRLNAPMPKPVGGLRNIFAYEDGSMEPSPKPQGPETAQGAPRPKMGSPTAMAQGGPSVQPHLPRPEMPPLPYKDVSKMTSMSLGDPSVWQEPPIRPMNFKPEPVAPDFNGIYMGASARGGINGFGMGREAEGRARTEWQNQVNQTRAANLQESANAQINEPEAFRQKLNLEKRGEFENVSKDLRTLAGKSNEDLDAISNWFLPQSQYLRDEAANQAAGVVSTKHGYDVDLANINNEADTNRILANTRLSSQLANEPPSPGQQMGQLDFIRRMMELGGGQEVDALTIPKAGTVNFQNKLQVPRPPTRQNLNPLLQQISKARGDLEKSRGQWLGDSGPAESSFNQAVANYLSARDSSPQAKSVVASILKDPQLSNAPIDQIDFSEDNLSPQDIEDVMDMLLAIRGGI